MTDNLENKTKKEILIVDDEYSNRKLLGYLLENSYNIRKACNGKQAYEEIEKKMPDLVISDVDMPEMNGFGFLEKIKDNKKYKNLKVIVNSGGSYNSNDFKKYKNVIKFLQKPYGLDELKNSVKDALYNSH